jgi:hypothetical protein
MGDPIHRKPTFTDTLIPYSSNHPTQHKYAAMRFLYNKLSTYLLQKKKKVRKNSAPYTTFYQTTALLSTHKNILRRENPPLP